MQILWRVSKARSRGTVTPDSQADIPGWVDVLHFMWERGTTASYERVRASSFTCSVDIHNGHTADYLCYLVQGKTMSKMRKKGSYPSQRTCSTGGPGTPEGWC